MMVIAAYFVFNGILVFAAGLTNGCLTQKASGQLFGTPKEQRGYVVECNQLSTVVAGAVDFAIVAALLFFGIRLVRTKPTVQSPPPKSP